MRAAAVFWRQAGAQRVIVALNYDEQDAAMTTAQAVARLDRLVEVAEVATEVRSPFLWGPRRA